MLVLMLLHTVNMGRDCIKHKGDLEKEIGSSQGLLVLLLTLDTLGIGSFAPTSGAFGI